MTNNGKYRDLITYLKELGKVVLAFSGGVDSTFLLKAAKEALGNNVKAVTIFSPYIPRWEIEEAKQLVKELGVEHEIIEAPLIDEIKFNPPDRCYLCKTAVFTKIKEVAAKEGFKYVIDGTNVDDINDYRPGLKALKELAIKSPLMEIGIGKDEVRGFSKELGLQTWDKPPYACLLSRIPYNEEIKIEELDRIERSEKFLIDLGFRAVRVRSHRDLARVELPKNDIYKLLGNNLLEVVSTALKGFGFRYVTIDIEGYRTGSLNEELLS